VTGEVDVDVFGGQEAFCLTLSAAVLMRGVPRDRLERFSREMNPRAQIAIPGAPRDFRNHRASSHAVVQGATCARIKERLK